MNLTRISCLSPEKILKSNIIMTVSVQTIWKICQLTSIIIFNKSMRKPEKHLSEFKSILIISRNKYFDFFNPTTLATSTSVHVLCVGIRTWVKTWKGLKLYVSKCCAGSKNPSFIWFCFKNLNITELICKFIKKTDFCRLIILITFVLERHFINFIDLSNVSDILKGKIGKYD